MDVLGTWSCRLTNLHKHFFNSFLAWLSILWEVSFPPISLETSSIPIWGRGSFISPNEISVAHAEYLLGSFSGSTLVPIQLKSRKVLPFLYSLGFQKAQKINCKKYCLKKIFDSCSIKTWKIEIIVFNIARNLNLEFELWLHVVLYSLLTWSVSYSLSDGIFENISLWFWLFILL